MTELTSPVPDEFAPSRTGPPLTAYGLALLPLGLSGLLPLWGAALLCGLFALGVRYPAWAQTRVLGTQFLIALSVAAQVPAALHDSRRLVLLAATALLLSVAGFALNWGAQAVEEGRRRGLLALLPGLLAPQPGLILALVGGALARPARLAHHEPRGTSRWWVWVLGPALLLAFLSTALPHRSLTVTLPGLSTPAPDGGARPPARPPTATATGTPGPGGQSLSWQPPFFIDLGNVPISPEWSLVLGVLCLASGLTMPRLLGRRGRRPTAADLLMTVGLLTTGALWFLASVILYLDRSTGGAALSKPGSTRPTGQPGAGTLDHAQEAVKPMLHLPWLVPGLVGSTLLMLALLAASLYWLRGQSASARSGATNPADVAGMDTPDSPPPLHRVRAAYRAALTALSDAGLGRAAHETPAGYAARLGTQHPILAEPLGALTLLYEPVRYGGQLTDEQADLAEQSARSVLQIIPTLPPAEDPADDKDTP